MNADYSDTVKWDETRKTYVDAYGYSSTQRSRFVTPAKIIAVPSEEGINLSVPVSSKKIEFSSDVVAGKNFDVDGTTTLNSQLTMAGTAPIVMNSNYIRLQGLTDSQSIRYNTSNSNVEINGFTGTRILTGTNGATNASQFDANGLQSRKYARSSGAYSTNPGTSRSVTQNTRSLLFLGPTFNNGVSGSSWSAQNIDGGSVVVAPFAGTIRASARIYMESPNTSMQFLFFRIYHPTNNASYVDGEEGLSAGGVSSASYDLRDTMWGIFVVAAGERIGIAADNTNTTKSFTVLDYHFEYIA